MHYDKGAAADIIASQLGCKQVSRWRVQMDNSA